jgi:acetoin utilization protein AcuB
MQAQDLMSTKVVTVHMDTRVTEIQAILQQQHFHHLPVVEDDKLEGIISDRDLLRLISPFIGKVNEQPRDLDTLNRAAHQIMTRQPITVGPSTPIEKVIDWMLNSDISCLPVVDEERHILGIITWRDILRSVRSRI